VRQIKRATDDGAFANTEIVGRKIVPFAGNAVHTPDLVRLVRLVRTFLHNVRDRAKDQQACTEKKAFSAFRGKGPSVYLRALSQGVLGFRGQGGSWTRTRHL
jgi:hypothetical protein